MQMHTGPGRRRVHDSRPATTQSQQHTQSGAAASKPHTHAHASWATSHVPEPRTASQPHDDRGTTEPATHARRQEPRTHGQPRTQGRPRTHRAATHRTAAHAGPSRAPQCSLVLPPASVQPCADTQQRKHAPASMPPPPPPPIATATITAAATHRHHRRRRHCHRRSRRRHHRHRHHSRDSCS